MATELDEGETFFFHARDLKNLVMVDEMESLAPIMHCKVIFLFFKCNSFTLRARAQIFAS